MSATGFDAFDHASETAHAWLPEVAEAFGTDDQRFAYRALRAWLHTLRDRLTADAAAHLAAGLPELLRGVFYDGWQPAKVPIKYSADEYRRQFAQEAGIGIEEVDVAAGAVTAALYARLTAGQLDQAFDQLPHQLRTIMRHPAARPAETTGTRPEPSTDVGETVDERIDRLQTQLDTLTEAVRALVRGFEQTPYQRPGDDRASEAARLAHQLLLSTPVTPQE